MWYIYALLGAIGKSYSGFFRKKMVKSIDTSTFLWFSSSFILLVLSPFIVTRLDEVADLLRTHGLFVAGAALTMLTATAMNLAALKREQLSYVAPLNAFAPVFTLLIAAVFLNEKPPAFGLLGIAGIVVGAYVVNIKAGQVTSWRAPLKRLLTSTGAQLSLGVAFLYAVDTVITKSISNFGYSFYTIIYVSALMQWLMLAYVPLTKRKQLAKSLRHQKLYMLGAASSSFAGAFFHVLAISTTYASYAISVRRLESVISVILGWRFLRETNIRYKLAGSIIMTAGVVALALS